MALARLSRFIEGMLGRRALSLEGVDERTPVHVIGEIASLNATPSPVSPVVAVALRWALLHRHVVGDGAGQASGSHPEDYFRVYADRVLASEILVRTAHGSLLVPAGTPLRLVFATPIEQNPLPLVATPPAELLELVRQDDSEHELYFNERYVSTGDRVAVKALVEPTRAGRGAYRAAGGGEATKADFVAIAGELCVIREL